MPPTITDPFGGRSIPEWIGSSPDAKVPDKVRDRVLERAGGRCHLSGMLIAGKSWQVEHASETEETGYWQDKAEGLQADLENAVETAFLRGAHEWTRLNYPDMFAAFSARAAISQATRSEPST